MKSPMGKLRRFVHKNYAKDKGDFQPSAKADELAQAAQVMQDMRNCYDGLLSAAAATANSAYEFSESLREMGSCLLEKTALHDDEESGRILLLLGNVQFELQKLVDSYRAHIFLTITNPSESLLSELRTVEEMKRQCDEKRGVYEYMVTQTREKGRSKSGKGESFTMQQLHEAQYQYDEDANLCVFRLKSLKQGQSRSLLTQAARHHAAQLSFFRKGLKSLEAVEPHIRSITEQQHIDYQFTGLEDDDAGHSGDDGENGYKDNDVGELTFDYRAKDVVSASRNSTEMNLDKNQGDLKLPVREPGVSSYSAPIIVEKKFDPAEKVRDLPLLSTRTSNTYVLPTPISAKGLSASRPSTSVPGTRPSGQSHNLHSAPLEEKKHDKYPGDGNFLVSTNTLKVSVGKESNVHSTSNQLPPPLAEGLSQPQVDMHHAYDTKKIKRLAFSGPLTSKANSTNPDISASVPITSTELPHLVSGMLSRSSITQPSSSPKVSPSASPPLISSPKISELHELPRPPGSLVNKPSKSPSLVGHSAPLTFRSQEHVTSKFPISSVASPLPTPPLYVSRSFSIPSSSQRTKALQVVKHRDSPHVPENAEEISSPPLTPISLSNI